ncbi:potassium ion transporter [Blumeria hordei DH14]|uniref:Potassium transport protein n=1 Tax=Blumeria graminis f. sp. hordei (strain DH14) TaxID=546991 RepID=N1JQK2_BLUG1|nr:potassium ion transporter [Blumeria hordei DH14]
METSANPMRKPLSALWNVTDVKNPHFNFITLHYFLIIGMSLIGSVCIYSSKNIRYIDALFLASGSATQTRKSRRTMNKTFSKAKTTDICYDLEERGQSKHKTRPVQAISQEATGIQPLESQDEPSTKNTEINDKTRRTLDEHDISREALGLRPSDTQNETMTRQIKFADQVKVENNFIGIVRLPGPRSHEEHIAVLQRQRNPEKGDVLRIPGPRDADAGASPHNVYTNQRSSGDLRNRGEDNEDENENETQQVTINTRQDSNISGTSQSRINSFKGVFTEKRAAAKSILEIFRLRKPATLKNNYLHNRHPKPLQNLRSVLSRDKDDTIPYLSWQPTIGRNSAFLDLSVEQREELGGIEYRSLKALAVVLVSYFWGFSFFGLICLIPWIYKAKPYSEVVMASGQGRVWWGVFTANSAFMDLGFTLTPDSMISFRSASWPLLIMSFLIIIGNTAFPIMLRVIIWVFARFSPTGSGVEQELQFLLEHPRRCFTLLFPAKTTLWLTMMLIFLNAVDLVFFIILDLGNTIVTKLPVRLRVLDGLFQAISTRTAGFSVVDLSLLHPAIQVSYLVMMYISVLPIAISVRRTNVYEERSLGIYSSPADEDENTEHSYVATHLRHQLSFDLWYISLGFFIISISEGTRLQSGDPRFTMFAVLFEIVSAYGTVGLSLGFSGINASFSAEFGMVAKLVIIAMQIRGRHRGLPNELDRAIILPSEKLQQKAEEDLARCTLRRRNSNATDVATGLSKTLSRGQATEILGAVFQPGPPLPRSYRNLHSDDSNLRQRPSFLANNLRERSPDSTALSKSRSNTKSVSSINSTKQIYEEVIGPSLSSRSHND